MRQQFDLSQLNWTLSGWTPHIWRMEQTMEIGASPNAEVIGIPAKVPGSVQYSLKEAGLIPDWNIGLNHRECEWVENRHWIYETNIPGEWIEDGKTYSLHCEGLDYCGLITVNRQVAAEFCGTHVPYDFDITSFLTKENNVLRIIFENPPRWLGQFGFTSQFKDWKARFNYTWDWTPRLVQIGIWNSLSLDVTDGQEIEQFTCVATADAAGSTGSLILKGKVNAQGLSAVKVDLIHEGEVIVKKGMTVNDFNDSGMEIEDFPVELWWPNLMGDQPLYDLTFTLLDAGGVEQDSVTRRVGFKDIQWAPCEGAPAEAYPWICVANGKPVFLQGINWVPILPNFADVTEEQYRKLMTTYKDLGLNILRVWGGAVLEREEFYNIADELGLMVWQEFPMSSSGLDNWPPEDEKSISEMTAIARSYIARRQHHVSLTLWCGGNELQGAMDGGKAGVGKPANIDHPMLGALKNVVEENDSTRRFVPTSPCGPVFGAEACNFGKGIHWHVHGPWKPEGVLENWTVYFNQDDANFRSETGAPGTSSAELIRKYAGEFNPYPCHHGNPLWRRTSTWWIEWHQCTAEIGREPKDLEEYVAWSQERQKNALVTAIKCCKDRFPKCGGFIIWMGHDCFPCTTNTAIIDFEGNPKPAALALREIWRS